MALHSADGPPLDRRFVGALLWQRRRRWSHNCFLSSPRAAGESHGLFGSLLPRRRLARNLTTNLTELTDPTTPGRRGPQSIEGHVASTRSAPLRSSSEATSANDVTFQTTGCGKRRCTRSLRAAPA